MRTVTQTRPKGLTEPSSRNSGDWKPAGHYDPDFVPAIEAALDELSQLGQNWDGYGSPPLRGEAIAAAKKFIRSLPENIAYRPRVVPMAGGNFQFEWHHGSKILELEFETDKIIHFLQWHPDAGVEEEGTFSVKDIEKAVDLIQWFMIGTQV